MRVLVFGGRDYIDVCTLFRVMDELDALHNIRCVIDGASDDVAGPYVGADYWAHQWALARNKSYSRQHAEWRKLGRAAGPVRNQAMIDNLRPDRGVQFPGGNGTADMRRRLDAAGIAVTEAV